VVAFGLPDISLEIAMRTSIALPLLILSEVAAAVLRPKVEKRASGNLNFCFGNNSICAVQDDLYNDCSEYQDPYNEPKYTTCICSNGYVAVEEA
jgi:hypothetical protein